MHFSLALFAADCYHLVAVALGSGPSSSKLNLAVAKKLRRLLLYWGPQPVWRDPIGSDQHLCFLLLAKPEQTSEYFEIHTSPLYYYFLDTQRCQYKLNKLCNLQLWLPMKYNMKCNAESTAALTLVAQVYTVLTDLMNSNYIEIPFCLSCSEIFPSCAFLSVTLCT